MRKIQVLVTRYAGDRRGPDISDALITSEAVAIERGRNEIDAANPDRLRIEVATPYLDWWAPGGMTRVIDAGGGLSGKITAWGMTVSIDPSGYQAAVNLTVEAVPDN